MCAARKPEFQILIALCCLFFGTSAVAQQPSRVESAADNQPLTRIEHTAPALASFANEVGRVEPERALARMILVLSPSLEKQQALLKFLDDQQNRRAPEYHHWLAPAEFGARFGAADTDTEAVRQWLRKSGLQVAPASQSKLWVEFSGTSAQVEGAFHTELHYYEWAGKKYLANATDIAIPAQFAGISRGVVSLNNFGKRPPRLLPAAARVQPNLTASGQTNVYYLAPGDFSAIYNTKGLLSGGIDGTGIAIAVTAQSEIELPDVQAFRQIFITSQPNDPNFIVSGPDPGVVGPVDMQEAELDVEWAGAVAPGATIDLVVAASTDTTSGVDLAAAYAIDNRVAPILTYTYGACEALLTPTQNEFYNSLWQQAAAEGITVLVASGDNGAAGCDSATSGLPATHGPAVNGAAATPYDVAVGGTQFADVANASAYWGSNNANFSSALGYIPEAAWNESCDPLQPGSGTNCAFGAGNFSLLAGGGGASILYAKPAWQSGPGVPADGMRDLPDVSLAAAASHDDIVYCNSTTGTACQINSQGEVVGLTLVGGTSVSTPAMAGILALVEEKNGAYQGQINYTLYKLAQTHSCDSSTQTNPTAQNSCVFYDITAGNNSVPCAGGTPGCSSQQSDVNGVVPGDAAGAGYDLATGLGSVNATNLANFWNTSFLAATQTTLQLPASFVHGTPVNVTGAVSPATGTGAPTGNLSLMTSAGAAADVLTLANGAFSATVSDLPGGSYNLSAHYAGDATFAPSDSKSVAVNISPEASNVSVSVSGLQNGAAGYGAPLNVAVNAAGVSGAGVATGSVILSDGGTTVGTYALTADGKVSIPTGGASGYSFGPGAHSLIASYSGDASFQAGSSAAIAFTVNKGAPFVVVGANSGSVPSGQSVGVHAIVSATGTAPATGTVQFTVDGAAQGAPIPLQVGGLFGTQAQASAILSNLSAGAHVIGAIYDGSGDANYSSVPSGNGANETTFLVTVGPGNATTPTTTTLNVAAAPAFPGDPGTFTVSVSPNTGNGAVTGTVALWDAVGPRGAPATITSGAATIQLEWTQGGTASVYAVYSGDANNAASSSVFHTFTVQPGTPQVAMTVQGPSGGLSQTSLIASVSGNLKQGTLASPTGFVEFWDSVNGGAPQLLTSLQLTPGAAGVAVAGTRVGLASGTHSLHAHYRGDNNWQGADSASTGAPSYALSFVPDPLSFKGGNTGTTNIVVTPAGGFTGTITLSCPAASFAVAGYTCSFNPAQVSITDGSAQSTILTLVPKSTAAAAAKTRIPGATFWAGVGLWWVAFGFSAFFYGGRGALDVVASSLRRWSNAMPDLGAGSRAWARGSAALVASLMIGCGGGGGGGGNGGGPLPTTTTIAVQQSGNQWSVSVSVHSSGTNPTGTVSLAVDGGAALTNGVSNGTANFGFSPSPMIGIHTLDARYSGDANNQASDSGAQTETFAGNATVVVAGASGPSTETAAVKVSVN